MDKRDSYVHIVRIYQGPTRTNLIHYDLTKCKMIGVLKISKDNISSFWKHIVNAGSNFFLEGSFYDYLTEEENKNWGDGKNSACIKYISRNFMFIKTLIFPRNSVFIPEPWTIDKMLETRKSVGARRLLSNLFHYELRLLSKTRKINRDGKYTITIPKALIGDKFDEVSRIIRLIPSAIMTVDAFYGFISVDIDIKAMRQFCGFYVDKVKKGETYYGNREAI